MGVRPRLCKGGATIGLAWHNRQPSLEVHRMMGPFRRLAHLIDQGPAGLAWSFIDPRWTASSQHDMDDPLGVGMRTLSPVEQWVKERYREN